jgi:hypothetical protein
MAIPAQMGQVKPALDALGPFPILQFFAALIVVIVVGVGGIAWLKGEKVAKERSLMPRPGSSPDGTVQLYFDGPLKAIFDSLQRIEGNSAALAALTLIGHRLETALATSKLETKDALAVMLSGSKHQVLNALALARADILNEINQAQQASDRRAQEQSQELGEMRDMLVRIEAVLSRRRS